MERNMDESRKAFEQWVNNLLSVTISGCAEYIGGDVYKDDYHTCLWQAWKASREEITKGSIVAYQDPYGNAVSAGDFDGGEDEMNETAFQEEWTPLVRAAGIKVKE
ncbi:hypothetical protein OUHCRE4_43220 [Enterobacter hormaechei subsp. steigerwaltii]